MMDAGVIPYKKQWCGILHHTAEEAFSENNLVRQFKTEAWKESLKTCVCLITLSEHLAEWVKQNTKGVPVVHLKHPTQFVPTLFTMANFKRVAPKKVVQVGGWLRNTYGIFDLPVVNHAGFQKFALKGKGMDHYYLTQEQFEDLYRRVQNGWDVILSQTTGEQTGGYTTGNCETPKHKIYSCTMEQNKYSPSRQVHTKRESIDQPNISIQTIQHISPYITGARVASLRGLKEKNNSVAMIGFVTNEEYDKLLSESVVFLNLVDASACNTILECIVRNTPVLVNPLPAVVEYLGKDYPLYYKSIDEAAFILMSQKKIKSAHTYLKNMNKTELTVEYFRQTLQMLFNQ